ncbi:hypothetical protein [Paenibacillus elgii]|uniref:hypothetical protein n=1 Tax=Paenibacillus elgii TaxID=189691 RepID=UPI0020423DC5|nr:hypothetical protein [Paenibacillus elgii]MCM3273894.1 hypothetical protein [Paenibacillus elgii]
MSTSTEKLQLVLPALSDEIQQTIQDLASNFQRLDNISDTTETQTPTTRYWKVNKKVWNSSPQSGQYIGWVNVREGQACPKWNPLYQYNMGDKIVPANDNGHYYECIQTGRSGPNEPSFPTTSGGSINDTQGASKWTPTHSYKLNEVVFPSVDNNRFYICTVSGVSGATEPVWSTVDGGTVSDGMVVWTGYRIVKWIEKGTSALFKPFGKIE